MSDASTRRLLAAAVVAATAWGVAAFEPAPSREITNVAAFARLYGVVRYFYPSDAAAALDWERAAVHGVRRVRTAADDKSLETALKELFGPLGPGIDIGARLPTRTVAGSTDPALIAWRYLGPGFAGANRPGPYAAKRTHRTQSPNPTIEGFATLMQTVPADDLRGKTVRLRGKVRAVVRDGQGAAALWLRVDRADRAMGFFDNMGDRPVRDAAWRDYVIEGPVAADATNVAFGVMASGTVQADFDAIDLEVRDASGGWTPLQIRDAGFEGAAVQGPAGWSQAGTASARFTRPTEQPPEGRQFLRMSGPSVPASAAELFDDPLPATGASVDVDLGSGLKARVPLTLSDADARIAASGALNSLRTAVAGTQTPTDQSDLDLRLADVVVAWNVFRHFYPYWSESGTDWDARLVFQLEEASVANSRDAQRDALRRLVADARDGHGGVYDARGASPRAILPIQLGLIDKQVVITASAVPSDAPVGAVVSDIDGIPASERVEAEVRLASGTPQWREARALREMTTCARGATIRLVMDSGAGPRRGSLSCDATQVPAEKRPQMVGELEPGTWYVDLTRASMAQVTPALQNLARADAVVFDLRGYPTDAGAGVLPYLIGTPENDSWMHVAKITGPFGQLSGWQDAGWNIQPKSPAIRGKVVFLTDGRAISYAESVMGYVADHKLGTIVGSTTAGTNGNVASFVVPSGFSISFTGMRVTRHDGKSPYHLVGVRPDVQAAPTIAGLRAGRDDVLDRGIALMRGK